MKHTSKFMVIAVLLALILGACAQPTPETIIETVEVEKQVQVEVTRVVEATEEPAEESTTVKIGVSLPLTGRRTEGGSAAKQGYDLWTSMINEAGGLLGYQVELIVLDNASDPDTAVSDYEKLITVDGVDLVVGPFSSALVFPSAAVAEKYGYAFIEPAGGAPEIFERCFNNLFFAQPIYSAIFGDSFVEWLQTLPDEEQPVTVAYPFLDDPNYLGIRGSMIPQLEALGYQTVYDEIFPIETTDWSSIALSMRNANADMIVGGLNYQTGTALIPALQEVGYQPKIFWFSNAPSFPNFANDLLDADEGILSSITWHPAFKTYQNDVFVDAYIAKYGGEAGDIAEDAANAFTVAQVLQQAVEATGGFGNTALIEYLHANTFNTVVGELGFDECGRPNGYTHVFQWQDNNIEIIYPFDAATSTYEPKPEW
jgi:branched-chain amino acid transport system substrate-binding protein